MSVPRGKDALGALKDAICLYKFQTIQLAPCAHTTAINRQLGNDTPSCYHQPQDAIEYHVVGYTRIDPTWKLNQVQKGIMEVVEDDACYQ
jgi:hypothetical protein